MNPKPILPFNWRIELENIEVNSINEDIILLDKPVIFSTFQYPFKTDVTAAIICIKGIMSGFINLKPYTTNGPCLVTILPEQILEYKSISDDFSGLFIIMSKRFTDNLMTNINERLPLSLSIMDNPVISLEEGVLEGMIDYFEMLKKIVQEKDHPYRLEVAQHLTLAFFYGIGENFHKRLDKKKKTHHEALVEKFLQLVQDYHKEQRGLEFYAGKLCLTPKHLSKVVRETSGRPANDWIDEHVVLIAKALLKSTNMTIQQVGDELNFPSQSFFGKYFKRVTGMSPREYKRKG